MIRYQIEKNLDITELKSIFKRSGLAMRRPVDNNNSLINMLAHGNLIITARDNDKLVGISRALTDYSFCTYLSDLAVDKNYQRQGIGKELIRQTKLASSEARLILHAAPQAIHYYPKIGMKNWDNCFVIDDENDLR
jgi:ribosomal protein S18 acetylase RimI-like enzyme